MPGIVVLTISFILQRASQMLVKKPKKPDSPGLSRTVNQAASPRQIVYGERKVGGVIFFMHTTRNEDDPPPPGGVSTIERNKFLHMAVAYAGHEIDGYRDTVLNDEIVPLTEPGGSAFAFASSGRYHGSNNDVSRSRLALRKLAGAPDQAADPQMLAIQATFDPNFPGTLWGPEHRAREHAYVYYRFGWNIDVFPNGVPSPSEILRGKRIFDPRNSLTLWSDNAALVTRDFLLDVKYGFGADATEVDDAEVAAAANVCDEQVPVAARSAEVTGDPATDVLSAADQASGFRLYRAMVVHVSSSGTLPAPLLAATDYYVIPLGRGAWQLAADLADARAGTAITLTDAGSGTHTLAAISELRYTCDAQYDTASEREAVLRGFAGAMAGRIAFSGGQWRLFAGAWRPPTTPTLDESDLAGPVTVQWRHKRRDLFNAVKGTHVGPDSDWTEDDFPPVVNAFYQTQDNGERRWNDIELPFTASPSMAQRIAKIELERNRQQITFRARFKLTALQLIAADTVGISHARYGWTDKLFEVEEWSFVEADDGGPALVIDCTLRETAAEVYDWAAGEETARDFAPDSSLEGALEPEIPGAPLVSEALYQGREGGGVKVKAVVTWAPAEDAFRRRYELDFKLSSETDWMPGPRVAPDILTAEVLDLEAGLYDFRVRMVNSLEVASAYSETLGFEILGLSAIPADMTGLTVSAIGGLALMRFDQHPDLDVRVGGEIHWRHSPLLAGALWTESTSIGEATPGQDTVATLPLKRGTYLAKARDSSKLFSANAASAVSKAGSAVSFSGLAQVNEHPDFLGAKSGVVAQDGFLFLAGAGLVDAIPDWDAVPSIDSFGGVASAGTYSFADMIDLASVKAVRLKSTQAVGVFQPQDLFDDRSDPMDSWENFDGADAGAVADSVIYAQETDDDPAASPTWSDWQRLDLAEFEARGFRFEARLSTSDPAYNIRVSQITIDAEEVI